LVWWLIAGEYVHPVQNSSLDTISENGWRFYGITDNFAPVNCMSYIFCKTNLICNSEYLRCDGGSKLKKAKGFEWLFYIGSESPTPQVKQIVGKFRLNNVVYQRNKPCEKCIFGVIIKAPYQWLKFPNQNSWNFQFSNLHLFANLVTNLHYSSRFSV